MNSISGPRIHMKNFPSQQSFKGTTHNTVYKSNSNYSVKEAKSRTGILSLPTTPQLQSQTHTHTARTSQRTALVGVGTGWGRKASAKILGQLVLTITFTLNLSHSYRNPFLHPHSECHAACSTYRRRKGKEEIAGELELQQSTIHIHLKHLAMTFIYFYLGPPLCIKKYDS